MDWKSCVCCRSADGETSCAHSKCGFWISSALKRLHVHVYKCTQKKLCKTFGLELPMFDSVKPGSESEAALLAMLLGITSNLEFRVTRDTDLILTRNFRAIPGSDF